MKEVSEKDLKSKIDAGDKFYLIDARSKEDFEHNHLPEAVNLAWGPEFNTDLSVVLPDKDSEIIVYGTNEACAMAKSAVDHLEKVGYQNIGLLSGGIMSWMEAGHALEFGGAS
jgi:rhodanese-related sulfurtransferase